MYLNIVCLNIHLFLGDESYDNYERHAGPVFHQLKELDENGFDIDGIHHKITVIHTSDCKTAACIDGNFNLLKVHKLVLKSYEKIFLQNFKIGTPKIMSVVYTPPTIQKKHRL